MPISKLSDGAMRRIMGLIAPIRLEIDHATCPRGKRYDALCKRDIAAASLVSQRWRVAALPYLFRDIVLRHPFNHEAEASGGAVRRKREDVQVFLNFLERPSALQSVERLLLLPAFGNEQRPLHFGEDVDPTPVLAIITRLTGLQELAIFHLDFAAPVCRPVKVKTLFVCPKDAHPYWNDIYKTLRCFEEVAKLHVVSSCGRGEMAGEVVDPRGAVTNLTIKSISFRAKMDVQPDQMTALHNFFALQSANLVELECELTPSHFSLQDYLNLFEGISWSCLQHLKFSYDFGKIQWRPSRQNFWQCVSQLLRRLTDGGTLQTFTLVIGHINWSTEFHPFSDSIRECEAVLLRLPLLKKCTLIVQDNPRLAPSQRSAVISRMPRLNVLGLEERTTHDLNLEIPASLLRGTRRNKRFRRRAQ